MNTQDQQRGGWLLGPNSIERLLAAGALAQSSRRHVESLLLTPSPLVVGRFQLVADAQIFAALGFLVPRMLGRGQWLDTICGPSERDDDALSLAMQASTDIRGALHQACRYTAYWSTSTDLVFDEPAGRVHTATSAPPSTDRNVAMAVLLATLARRLRHTVDGQLQIVLGIELAWQPDCAGSVLTDSVGVPVTTGAAQDTLVVDASVLDRPLPRAWQPFARFFEREVASTIAQLPDRVTLVDQVAAAIPGQLIHGIGGMLARIARGLGLSTRSLQRQLAAEGVTFRDLLDDSRRTQAQAGLADPRHTVGEVAFSLGFNDPSAFIRAFRRWTGDTPGVWRHRGTTR